MTTKTFLHLLTLAALACAVGLVLVMLLHAPAALAWAAIIGFPVLFGVLLTQLVGSQRRPATPGKPGIVKHEDGSYEVLR